MPRTEPQGPLTVELDIPITRRLKMHAVLDRHRLQVFHSRRISDVFTWLLDNEVGEFTMLDDGLEFRVSLRGPPLGDPNQRGPNNG